MTQRFYPYTPVAGEPLLCEHADCVYLAVWWDATHDALWCDVHAIADVEPPIRVQCEVCALPYPPLWVRNGVCVTCRSVMPLMWPDEEVKHDV